MEPVMSRDQRIVQLENIMEFPEKHLPEGMTATKENLRIIAREALFMKLDLEQAQ
jgi:hypothetical protein